MKKKKWFRTLSLADEKYISEAHPDNVIRSKKRGWVVSLVAACVCMAIAGSGLWLFMPFSVTPPDVSKYSGSEYYPIIEKLNELTFEKPKYKNNAQKLKSGVDQAVNSAYKYAGGFDAAPEMADGINGASGSAYREITDNQVEGIIEADRIKRSDTHIYYLDDQRVLRVYAIDKENSREVGSYALYEDADDADLNQWEFYLSEDCRTVTVITQCYRIINGKRTHCVNLISLDVGDPADIYVRGKFEITGNYMSSRMTNGSILLLTEFVIDKGNLDFGDETTFLPQINNGDGFGAVPADGIVLPDSLNNSRYTVVTELDEKTLAPKGTAAYLSYSDDVYVSENHVFLTRVFAAASDNDDGTVTRNSMTEISALAYGGEGFEIKGSALVRGYVKDQWSMDEYEGVLRVVVTTNATTIKETYYDNMTVSADILQTATGSSNASLYCIDLSSFEIVASVDDFAPPREEVQSVRFDGDIAYVCTSIERSDPVYFFDLSDLGNITYKDTGTIEGFSTSLINMGDGYLLGIGVGGAWDSFKVEVYEETADGVRSVCAYELNDAGYSEEYKSYYIDRENKLVGMGIVHNGECRYILLYFDGYELEALADVPLGGDLDAMRGVYIDGYMYMFGTGDFKVKKIFG